MANLANHPASRDQAKAMNRIEITKRMVDMLHRVEAEIGSMGLAVPIALGGAIAQPKRKVFALEGDGSILMQLGSLSTVAARAQKNLAIVIIDNSAYQINGGQ